MLIRVLDYYDEFRCLAGACPHSCCEKWEVVLDAETVCRYQQTAGPLGEKLRAAMEEDAEGDVCFALKGGRCPFLDEENLCEIHRQMGEEATSITCQEHPRFTEDYGAFREITLSASCPAANALLLGSEEPLRFAEWENGETAEEGDEWLTYLLPLRERMLALLTDRAQPLRTRLGWFLLLACDAQALLDEQCVEALPALAAEWAPYDMPAAADDSTALLPAVWGLLCRLEILEPDWPVLLGRAESAHPVPVSEPLLERIAVYFAFRYLLKAVNDGDLLNRAQLVVFALLAVERLAAVCGLPEALRRFSCEIEHSDENLEALLEAFRWEEDFSESRFLEALRI